MYGGLKFEDYLKYTGLTLDQFRANNKPRAIRDVKARLVFEELIKAESLELTDEDVDKEIQTLADSAKKSLEEYKKTMDPNHLDFIRNEALMNKLVAFLKDNNTFVAKTGAKPAAKKSSTKKTTEDKDSAANKPAAKKSTAKKSAAKSESKE
jgi:trigger factor